MKTKSNVQKTVLRFAAVVVSFVLISYTVSAHDFWKHFLENSSFGHLAMAMVETKNDASEAYSYDLEKFEMFVGTEAENNLELEAWMMDQTYFTGSSFNYEEVADEALELEAWMLSDEVWGI